MTRKGGSQDGLPDNVERERKFLVEDPAILNGAEWTLITQAYVFARDGYAVRVRREQSPGEGDLAEMRTTLTLKGPKLGDERREYEMDIPTDFALAVITSCQDVVRKKRYRIISERQVWEVDEFLDANQGLILAELEGQNIRAVRTPWWATRDVTTDHRYNNDNLARSPWTTWTS